jgi:ubiquinone/menaquinone biosynthesis C-methylase UbiE
MDDPALPHRDHELALRGLARLNVASGVVPRLWRVIRPACDPGGSTSVLDIAAGGGENLLGVWRLARNDGFEVEASACDIRPLALDRCRGRAEEAGAPLTTHLCDARNGDWSDAYDVAMCSLFLHHLDRNDAVRLLRVMRRAARRLVVVNDLDRSRSGFALAKIASRLATRSSVVHVDAPRSVAAAFTRSEARSIADEAGLRDARIEPVFPCRWTLAWRCP